MYKTLGRGEGITKRFGIKIWSVTLFLYYMYTNFPLYFSHTLYTKLKLKQTNSVCCNLYRFKSYLLKSEMNYYLRRLSEVPAEVK